MTGQWTVDGSAADLRALSVRLRATGQSGLKRNIGKAIRVATVPARAAVRQQILQVFPHSGGANLYFAASSIRSAVLTGPSSAGVVIRASKKGHDLAAVNRTGQIRHPVFGNRNVWATTSVPAGWWEKALEPFGPAVEGALHVAQNVTAEEAGFV